MPGAPIIRTNLRKEFTDGPPPSAACGYRRFLCRSQIYRLAEMYGPVASERSLPIPKGQHKDGSCPHHRSGSTTGMFRLVIIGYTHRKKYMSALPPKADMCAAIADVRFERNHGHIFEAHHFNNAFTCFT